MILCWAITGMYFAFPTPARSIIGALSPVTSVRPPMSHAVGNGVDPSWRAMIDRARRARPDAHVARVVLPFGDRGAFLVMFADASPTPAGSKLDAVYLDRHTAEPLEAAASGSTLGDRIVRSMAPLHVGTFGGRVVRWIWFTGGLMPVVLFVTGVSLWWSRRTPSRRTNR
jgi:uncharacterized iron-regulated membrane protein